MVEQPQETENESKGDTGQTGVLQRLLKARSRGDAEPEYAPTLPAILRLTPSRAAGMALSRVGNMLYDLPVQTSSVDIGGITLAELPELLPETGMLAVLQGPGDAMGVMALCMSAVASLVEIQSLGRVTSRSVPARRITRADALLCADFVNAALEEVATSLAPMKGFDGIGGFRYASYLTEARPLGLILEDKPHRSLSFKLKIGKSREANIFLAIPLSDPNDTGDSTKSAKQISQQQPAGLAIAGPPASVAPPLATRCERVSLRDNVQDAPVDVIGVLCRRMVTLGELRALEPGGILTLPRADLLKVQVELADGVVLATGKLGESGGCHAIRLHDTESAMSGDTAVTEMSFGHEAADSADDAFGGDFSAGELSIGEFPDAAPMEDMVSIDLSSPDEFREGSDLPDLGAFEGEENAFEQQPGVA